VSASRLTTHQRAPRRAARPLAASALLLASLLALAACGSDSNTTSTAATASAAGAGQRPGGGARFAANPKVQACLKKQGVTLPAFGGRGRGRPGGPRGTGTNAQPPTGTSTQPPTTTDGRPPAGANGRRFGGRGRNSAQFAKMQAALKKCGATLPSGGGGRFRGGAPNGGAQTSTTPSATKPS
jgi:hypothetical protein